MGFIDTMRGEGFAVETICAVLREQGMQVAARTYRAWKTPGRVLSARTVSDAVVVDAMIEVRVGAEGRATPESLYGRRKMTALLRRRGLPVAHCTGDRPMRTQGMNGVRRGQAHRTTIPGKDGVRAGDLLGRDFTAPAPNRIWIADFTYVRTWVGFVYVAFVVDWGYLPLAGDFAQRIVGWHAMTTKPAELVLIPLRMAAWSRGQQGHPVTRGDLIAHSDAGSQGGFNWSSQHLDEEVAQWPMGCGRSRFVSTGDRSPRRGGLRSLGGRTGSGSGPRSVAA